MNKELIDRVYEKFQDRKAKPIGEFKRSSVMILLNKVGENINIIFEVRALTLKNQPGDVCLPGGKIEKGESPLEAALRETVEELNIDKEKIKIMGQMDYFISPYNFFMHPFVAMVEDAVMVPNKEEVDHIFEVPIEFFLENSPTCYEVDIVPSIKGDFPFSLIKNGKNYKFGKGTIPEYFYQYEGKVIWGFTALIVKNFIDIIKDEKN
ncbi:CoA pyrophosphatase [Clostridium sporogenes]|uniref:CoA pyrophosphatase n=1 Tax=Clostridium botulinum TaxID=1491 RepID=A0A6M0SZE6_CLOBO|nr:CoA pyrophosphatase [Clostridium sporogenes]NFA60866.1 CoA pyrophosphatase [Clostridium botulinum]NFI72461.1 CoA pyrophosphatase [Clostridium sporogenes]NFL73507.1 CoA pyrophosphatase [Clostridium sporogenes]NFM25937.1 CoA pyrophosphatase [Clostridium sporogenes]NFP60691.1 CoA pyrophosphatase [Clostridium sporogenes]